MNSPASRSLSPASVNLEGGAARPDSLRSDNKSVATGHLHILYTIIRIAPLLVVTKLAIFGRDVVVAAYFGTGDAVDAFIIAFLLPSFAISVVGGSLNVAFIPTYVGVLERDGREAAGRLLGSATFIVVALLICLSIVLALGAPSLMPVLGAGFGTAKIQLSCHLLNILLPVLVLAGPVALLGGVLNAHGSFAVPALSSASMPFMAMAFVAISGRTAGITTLAVGMLVGGVFELLILVVALWKGHAVSVLPKWHGVSSALLTVGDQFLPMIAGSIFMSISLVVDQAMAAALGSGNVAALNYGGKLIGFAIGVGSVSLSAAVLPHFSRMVVRKQWASVRRTLRTYSTLIFGGSLILTAVGVSTSAKLVELMFQRGSFTSADANIVSSVQSYYLLQLPFHLTGMLYVRFMNALGKNRVLLVIGLVNLVVDVAGNVLLSRYLGVAGIALSTAIVYVISFSIGVVYVWTWLARAAEPRAGIAVQCES